MCDLMNEEVFVKKVRENVKIKNAIIEKIYGGEGVDAEEIISDYLGYAKKLKKYAADTTAILYNEIKAGQKGSF